jgi:hypothetical protein
MVHTPCAVHARNKKKRGYQMERENEKETAVTP